MVRFRLDLSVGADWDHTLIRSFRIKILLMSGTMWTGASIPSHNFYLIFFAPSNVHWRSLELFGGLYTTYMHSQTKADRSCSWRTRTEQQFGSSYTLFTAVDAQISEQIESEIFLIPTGAHWRSKRGRISPKIGSNTIAGETLILIHN